MTEVLMVKENWRGQVQLMMAKFAFVDYTEASDFLQLVKEKLGYEGYMQTEKVDFDDGRRWLRFTGHNAKPQPLGTFEHHIPVKRVSETKHE